jgi:CBS domain containing-hemolysin-like protein
LELVRSAFVKLRYEPLGSHEWAQLRKNRSLAFLLDHMERAGQVLETLLVLVPIVWVLGLGWWVYEPWPQPCRVATPLLALRSEMPWLLGCVLAVWSVHHVLGRVAVALGMQYAKEVLQANARLLRVLCVVVGPFLRVLDCISKLVLKAFGIQQATALAQFPDAYVQIRALGEKALVLNKTTLNIIQNTLRMKDLEASDILLPRDQVKYLDLHASLADNLKKAREEGYTRYPVCEHDLDHCTGWVHIKDLLLKGHKLQDLRTLQRPMVRVNLRTPVHVVLRRFLQKHIHVGLVYDDFQRFVGLITLEHILEELVGDIQDEFDAEGHYIAVLADGSYRVAGLTPVHDIEATFGITLDYPDVSTFGGLVIAELGRIPEKNETLQFQNLSLVIDEVSPRRVISAVVRVDEEAPLPQGPDGGSQA